MRRLRFTLAILGFAMAVPASATITYTSCSSGCGSTSGGYASLPTQTGATGLAFSSTITFVSAGMSGTPAFYTDSTTGTVMNGFSNTTADALSETGTTLAQSVSGTGASIQIVLPADTYALGMVVGANLFSSPWVELVSSPSGLNTGAAAQYQMFITGGTSQFFGIVSDVPITSIFVWNSGGGGILNLQSFEIGQDEGSPTPEAATFFSMGSGLLGLYFWRRPRHGCPAST
jgi:hypothetical protein